MVFIKTKKAFAGAYCPPARRPHGFFHTASILYDLFFAFSSKKVSKKRRSPNYVLHPIIYDI
jgi:hypothetical protein